MRRTGILLAAALFAGGVARAGDGYTIDNGHSTVGFSVKHLVISTTHGKFNDYAGKIAFDEKDVTKSSVQVAIKAASIDTGVEARDKHLRAGDFFDAEKFPDITFASKKIEKSGDSYKMTGTLTIKGVSKDVSFPFALSGPVKDPWGNVRIGAEGALVINRQDYGVSWSQKLDTGGAVVGDEVKIALNIEAMKDKAK